MKPVRWMLTLVAVATLSSGSIAAAAQNALPAAQALALPPLKAVLIVGPLDGDSGAWTAQEKQNMDLAAAELAANGVTVHKFYTPNNDWGQITTAAEGAHFLLYRGHGVYWSDMPNPIVGGFALRGRTVSADEIRAGLHLAPNAIVMLYGSFTAGSSGNDAGPITGAEARRRVAQYSDPFFDIGAAGYFADWFGDAFQMFVRYLFEGKSLRQAYETYFDFNAATVERTTHPDHADLALWLDKDDWGGIVYNNAFAGLPDATLTDLFVAPAMSLSAPAITAFAEPSFAPQTFTIGVDGTTADPFTWTASVEPPGAAWASARPSSGADGQQLTVVVTPTGMLVGTYQVSLRVVTRTPGILNGDQLLPVTLYVVDRVQSVYLPNVLKSSP